MSTFSIDTGGRWSGGGGAVLNNLAELSTSSDLFERADEGPSMPIVPRNIPSSARRLFRPFVWMPQNALPWGPPVPGERRLQHQLRILSECSAQRAAAMIRISGAIPPLTHGKTSPVVHNVLDEPFDRIMANLKAATAGGFLSIGSAHAYRGFSYLVSGYVRYRETGGRQSLLIVASRGSDGETRRLQAAEKEVRGLTIRPRGVDRATAISLMASSKGLIFPSFIEASPMSVLEAQALGKPIAHSRILGHSEIVAQYPAFTFAAGDPQDLAKALHRLDEAPRSVESPLRSAGHRAVKRAEWVSMLETFLREAL